MNKKNLINVVCYKLKTPKVYGRGTSYEEYEDTFLSYYSYKDAETTLHDVERLNTEKPTHLWNGEEIDWEKIAYFFMSQQEPFED